MKPDLDEENRATITWIDLSVATRNDARGLLAPSNVDIAHTLRVYPVPVVYTSVCRGKTKRQAALLEWMYGEAAAGGAAA